VVQSTSEPVREIAKLPVLRFTLLEAAGVVHGVTTRTPELPLHGNMSYMVGDAPDLVAQNRRAWATAIGYQHDRLVLGRQVHETTILSVDESHAGRGADTVETSIRGVDGLITSTPGIPIGVMAADCVPILLFDQRTRTVGAVHAGWRGTVDGIASAAVSSMQSSYGTDPMDLRVCLGPSICARCYQVGNEVVDRWQSGPCSASADPVRVTGDGIYFDLRAANVGQLLERGVPEESIEVSSVCTRCANGSMFSRRGLGPRTGLFTSVIMLSENV
jgi:polyphenol oxidase